MMRIRLAFGNGRGWFDGRCRGNLFCRSHSPRFEPLALTRRRISARWRAFNPASRCLSGVASDLVASVTIRAVCCFGARLCEPQKSSGFTKRPRHFETRATPLRSADAVPVRRPGLLQFIQQPGAFGGRQVFKLSREDVDFRLGRICSKFGGERRGVLESEKSPGTGEFEIRAFVRAGSAPGWRAGNRRRAKRSCRCGPAVGRASTSQMVAATSRSISVAGSSYATVSADSSRLARPDALKFSGRSLRDVFGKDNPAWNLGCRQPVQT